VDPADVDWENFPVLAALEAVTYDELRRLRGLLDSDLARPRRESSRPGPLQAWNDKTPTGHDSPS
jgi:hypothetical protein